MAKTICYRPEGTERTLIGRGFPKEYQYVDPDGYNQELDTTFIDEITELFHALWPSFTKELFVNSYPGLYDVTPDWHPVLGRDRAQHRYFKIQSAAFRTGGDVQVGSIVWVSPRSQDVPFLLQYPDILDQPDHFIRKRAFIDATDSAVGIN